MTVVDATTNFSFTLAGLVGLHDLNMYPSAVLEALKFFVGPVARNVLVVCSVTVAVAMGLHAMHQFGSKFFTPFRDVVKVPVGIVSAAPVPGAMILVWPSICFVGPQDPGEMILIRPSIRSEGTQDSVV